MANNVNIDLSGEINATTEKPGLQKWIQQIRSQATPALVLGILNDRRPWTQFVTAENFKVPASVPRLSRRVLRNIEYFQANYFIIFLGLIAYCLITSPLLLFTMVASIYGYRKFSSGAKWKIAAWEISRLHQHALTTAFCVAVCWAAGAGAVLFWVLGATTSVVALHAIMYDAECLPPKDDPEKLPMIEEV